MREPRDIIKSSAGQSLIEMLVAMSIIVVALLGILALINRSLGLNRVTAEHYTATYLASEGIELVRNLFERQYLEASPGSQSFYGWVPTAGLNSLAPTGSYGLYLIDYDATDPDDLNITASCTLGSGDVPTEAAVRNLLFACPNPPLPFLNFNSSTGIYSYDLSEPVSKFKRVIIIDRPAEFSSVPMNLDYRVTSAVGWESRGGKFTVQLQDHFLPWRIP